MKIFHTLDELIAEIEQDSQHPQLPSAQRYPIRFIFLPHLWMLKKLVNALNTLRIQNVELPQELPHDDGWLTVDGIINIVKELDPKHDHHVVLPFSEVVRFFPDDQLRAVLNRLTTEFENTGNLRKERRLYFPLVGIHERFEKVFWRNFHRSQEWAPIWKVEGEHRKIRVFLVERQRQTPPAILSIPNTKTWLNLWKHDETDAVLCYSKILAFLSKNTFPDHAFDLKKIQNAKELICAVYDVHLPLPYETQDASYWDVLWATIQGKWFSDFDDIVKQLFNRRKIERERLFDLWIEKTAPFYRWLLKWYALSRQDWKESYLSHVFGKITNFEDNEFIKIIWLHIFEADPYPPLWIQERKELLKKLFKHFGNKVFLVEYDLKDALAKFAARFPDNPLKKTELCTGITVYERKLTIELLQSPTISKTALRKIMTTTYPELSSYVSDMRINNLKHENAWIKEYFREYRWSKIRHAQSPRLQELLVSQNANKETFYRWYYAFPSPQTHPLFQEEGIEKVVWIDGLGVEWLPLLVKLIEEQGLTVEKTGVARTNVPSITECNRFENAQHIMQLDKFIHGQNHYTHPDDLIAEINVLAGIVNDYLLTGERTVIVSDHGFSAFTIKAFANSKKYDFAKADHEGRCLWTDADFLDDDDFFVHTPEDSACGKGKKCLIPLKWGSLYNTPRREVHGGATPEEVLVPLLLISKRMQEKEEDVTYTITVTQQKISIRNPHLDFSIEPEPEYNPILRHASENVFDLEYNEQTKIWSSVLHGLKAGDYSLDIEIGQWQGKIAVTLKGGMQEKDLF